MATKKTATTTSGTKKADIAKVETEKKINTDVKVDPARCELVQKLADYGIGEEAMDKLEELGAETIDDLRVMEVEDLVGAGVKLVTARKLLAEIKGSTTPAHTPPVPARATSAETRAIQTQLQALLPTIPTDESWLTALKTGGILKVDQSSYIAAIRAALANRAGLYNVPEALAKAMERFADETEEQVDPTFFALRKSLTRRNYGEIFAAIDGLDGTFITDSRRKEFLTRINDTLWPAIADSYHALNAWYQTWRASFADPGVMMELLSGALGGGVGMSMAQQPDTAPLHDAADTLVNSINRVFRGTGIQVAAALAYDANTIRNTLEDPHLPAMIGVKNRELMLKKIGVNVSSNYVRLEQNLVKYVLAFVNHDTVTSDIDVSYFTALWQLGSQINWAELGVTAGTNQNGALIGITGKTVL